MTESVQASESAPPSECRPDPPSEDDEEFPTDEESTTNRPVPRMAHTSTCSNREQYILEQELLMGRLEDLRKSLVKPIIGYAVVLVFLSAETLQTYTQPPAGLDENGHLQTGVAIVIFSIFSSMSFYTSISALVLCVGCFLPRRLKTPRKFGINPLRAHRNLTQDKVKEVTVLLMKVVGVNVLLVVSLCFCVGAHAAAGFAVAASKSSNRLAVLITTVIGGWMFASCVLSLLQDALKYAKYEGEPWMKQIFSMLLAMVYGLLSSLPFTGLVISYFGGFCQSFFPDFEERMSDSYLRHCFNFWKQLVEEMTDKKPWSSTNREAAVYQNPTFLPFMQQQSSYTGRVVPTVVKPVPSGSQ